jgi:hypothetical protein
MKRFLLFLALAALPVGCDARGELRSARRLSTEPTTWLGHPGTAVTIQFETVTEQFKGARDVGFKFHHSNKGEFWDIADFTVPVMKVEPRAVTLFFANREKDSVVLSHLPEEIRAGALGLVPCDPNRVCP